MIRFAVAASRVRQYQIRSEGQSFNQDNQLTSTAYHSGSAFAYDGDGDAATYSGKALGFDVEGRLNYFTTGTCDFPWTLIVDGADRCLPDEETARSWLTRMLRIAAEEAGIEYEHLDLCAGQSGDVGT